MHVLFVSLCKLKGRARSARVLDAYALRSADTTWTTPITQEGLDIVRAQLRSVATRQTAVACYVNDGRERMRLAWIVGSQSAFGPHGQVPVASRTVRSRSRSAVLPLPLRAAALLAEAAGYAHDWGKFGLFQLKLRGKAPSKDDIRHEWISLHLLCNDVLQNGWVNAWKAPLTRMPALTSDMHRGLTSAWSALLYLVYTHHRLAKDDGGGKGWSNVLDDAAYIAHDGRLQDFLKPLAEPSARTVALLRGGLRRVARLQGEDALYWRAVATVARIALILADHKVSAEIRLDKPGHGHAIAHLPQAAFANTARDPAGRSVLNQELNWHLQNVGQEASRMVHRIMAFQPSALSEGVRQDLRCPQVGRFAWQSANAEALHEVQRRESLPTLVFNIAGTGSGKTRANVVFLDALRRGEPLRFVTGLNLRTLTLQTRDAYARQLGMSTCDLACVIGSQVARQLHDARSSPPAAATPALADEEDEDGNPPEDLVDTIGDADPAPPWLEHFLARHPRERPLLMAPVVVATADFMVRAGDPTQQRAHALAMIRLRTSDLILDEIDSYDPKSLIAVMRLVTAAAMWGRNVVASSATLALPVAAALHDAYRLGHEMGRVLGVVTALPWRQILVCDRLPAAEACLSDRASFADWYEARLKERCEAMPRQFFRRAEMARVDLHGGVAGLLRVIAQSCRALHARHGWTVDVGGREHRVSIGFVRMANIAPAVEVAKYLCRTLPEARVACYHAQLPRLHRHRLEAVLSALLQRHPQGDTDPGKRLLSMPEVRSAIESSMAAGRSETMFIVVATPVAEVGQDLDFDWAVLEPSSTQSMVQGGGRVNRHRLVNVDAPNIIVLQYNLAAVKKRSVCFARPGLESADAPYPSHDLAVLIDWTAIDAAGQIDARLRYATAVHAFAKEDDRSCRMQIKTWGRRFLESASDLWMGASTYDRTPLRENDVKETWTRDAQGVHYREERIRKESREREFVQRSLKRDDDVAANAWLHWSASELADAAAGLGLTAAEALAVEVRPPPPESRRTLVFHEAFGYRLCDA